MGVLEGKITIPKVGSVPKKVVVLIGGAGAAFVAYRWYIARSGAGDGTAEEGSEFADGGLPPGVIGAVSPTNSYGDVGDTGTDTTQSTTPTTNSEWSNLAATQLSQSDTWSYTDIVTALGNYLSGTPLSTAQQAIVRAAIAVAGYPPVGTHSIVSGGDTAIIVAPTGFSVTTTSTGATLTASPVAGAASYRAYLNTSATNVGTSVTPTITIGNLLPGKSYKFHMRAVTASGAVGPSSDTITMSTKAASSTPVTGQPVGGGSPAKPALPKAPGGFSVTTTATTARLKASPVSGATSYRAYRSGSETNVGTAGGPDITIGGLQPGKSYKFHMRAVNSAGLGPASKDITTKTKAK